jgi:hypothetical protein
MASASNVRRRDRGVTDTAAGVPAAVGTEITVATTIITPTAGVTPAIIAAATVTAVESGIVVITVISRTAAEIDADIRAACATT